MLADQHHQQQTSLSTQQEPVVTIPVWPYGPGGGGGQSGQPMEPIPEEEDFASPTSSYSLRTDAQRSLSPGSATANTTTISSFHRAHKTSPSPRDSSATTTTITTTKTSTGKPNSPITDNSLASDQDADLLPVRTVESKHRVKEIYTTEEVDTLVSFMANKLVQSNRIGERTVPITLTADGSGCYTWTQHGRITTLADGSEQVYLNCAGCRSVIQKKEAAKKTIKTVKY